MTRSMLHFHVSHPHKHSKLGGNFKEILCTHFPRRLKVTENERRCEDGVESRKKVKTETEDRKAGETGARSGRKQGQSAREADGE